MATVEFLRQLLADVLTDTVIAVIILLIGFIVGRILGKLVQGILHELELDTLLSKIRMRAGLEEFLGTLVSYLVYAVAVVMALNQVGITQMVMNVVAGIAIIMIIVSLLLTVKDYAPNLVAGIRLRQKRALSPGDWIGAKGLEGKVLHAGLLETRIETKQKDIIYIPNVFLVRSGPLRVRKR